MIPIIKPIQEINYTYEQSKYKSVEKIPFRSLLVGPSGSGKSVLISNMILDIYKNCFSAIYIFSHSINIDSGWNPIKEYIKENYISKSKQSIKKNILNKDNKEDETSEFLFDKLDIEALTNIIDTQSRIIEYLKMKKQNKLFSILIVLDDMQDDKRIHNSDILNLCYIRGRHLGINIINSIQTYKSISPIIRKNISGLYLFKIRNITDFKQIKEEMSAIAPGDLLEKLYNRMIKIKYQFLYIDLINSIIHINFEVVNI